MTSAETTLRYGKPSLIGDYLRGGGGLAVSLAALFIVPALWWTLLIFGGLALLFAWFLLRTFEKQVSAVTLAPQGVILKGFRERRLAWRDLKAMSLRFYGTRREVKNREGGFLQLKLAGPEGSKLVFDSSLEGFDRLAEEAAGAARREKVTLDAVTADCLLNIGIEAGDLTPTPGEVGP